MVKLSCLLLFLLVHGDLHERIAKLTKQIEADNCNAALYVQRADLYFQHEDYALCKGDLLKAGTLSGEIQDLDFLLARVLHILTENNSALKHISRYMEDPDQKNNVAAVLLQADILSTTGEHFLAARNYEAGIVLSASPSPDLYLNAANAYLRCVGREEQAEAIRVLQQAKLKLGDLYVFDRLLIQIKLTHEDYDSAIALLTNIIGRSRRKATFYIERAEIYLLQGHKEHALRDLDLSQHEIQNLPGHLRNNSTSVQLLRRISAIKDLIQ